MKASSKAFILMGIITFSYLVMVGAAGTRLQGDTLIFDIGEIRSVETLDAPNHALFITDSGKSTIVAMFNADPLTPVQTAESLIANFTFPNTTTSFLGDVNNFDDINNFSRFKETNLNNGTNAAAGFQAVNDEGFELTIGIGSSNFEFAGIPFPNQGAINHISPGGFNFANGFFTNWEWRANILNESGINFTESMQLSPEGNLNIGGNFTGNQFYGEMFLFDLDSPVTIVIEGLGLENLTKITGFEVGSLNGFNFDNDTLVNSVEGLYKVDYNLVYQDQTNSRHGFAVLVNEVIQNNTASASIIGNANDISNVGGSGFIQLEEGDIVNLAVGDRFVPLTNIDVLSASINLMRVGD